MMQGRRGGRGRGVEDGKEGTGRKESAQSSDISTMKAIINVLCLIVSKVDLI